jgi:hypothetical protein
MARLRMVTTKPQKEHKLTIKQTRYQRSAKLYMKLTTIFGILAVAEGILILLKHFGKI